MAPKTHTYTASVYDLAFTVMHSVSGQVMKGTAALMISMFYQKEIYEPGILIQVLSKSVEKWGNYGHLKNSI